MPSEEATTIEFIEQMEPFESRERISEHGESTEVVKTNRRAESVGTSYTGNRQVQRESCRDCGSMGNKWRMKSMEHKRKRRGAVCEIELRDDIQKLYDIIVDRNLKDLALF